MKNGSKEPDWGKFGLDGERQPLNPGSSGLEHQRAAKEGKDLYGGHVVEDNELFADDQGSKAQPWWLSQFLVSERVLFGTWDGVFTSCLINIFGVIVFLRSGWIVGEAGIGHASLIVLAAVALILVAVLAAIGICERCHVQSGGVYFLISHVLGSRRGTAVGILYVLGQAIGNALCATGFGESIAGLISETETPNPWIERSVAAFVIIMLTLINLAGVKWVIRLQFLLLSILVLCAMDFGVGSFTHTNEALGFHGWNLTVWRNNSRPAYTEHHNWFSVFGVFFPALTGVMAGINMSGDLKNPSQDISIGTLAAVATASFIYIFFMVVLAGTCDRAALLTDYVIAEKVSALGFLLLSAVYISSASSCLATLYGTPRVLQSIAAENIIPGIAKLAEGKGPNKVPVKALLSISMVTLLFILIGDMNRLATLATMPFLITYGAIEYSYFALCQQFEMNQRRLQNFRAQGSQSPTFDQANQQPAIENKRKGSGTTSSIGSEDGASVDSRGDPIIERKGRDEEFEELLEKYNVDEIEEKPKHFYSSFCNRWISISGFFVKLVMMFLIHWGYSLLCLGLCLAIYWYVGHTAPKGTNKGIAAEFSLYRYFRTVLAKVTGGQIAPPKEEQFVVTPVHPGVKTRSSQMNDMNSDFANRSLFHQTQTHTVENSQFQNGQEK